MAHKLEIVRDDEEDQFVALMDGTPIGEIMYMPRKGYLDIYHTGVAEEFEGMGLASVMAHATLDFIRESGLKIWVRCPYLSRYIEKHPEYKDLIYE
ncbi:MAG: N-acetyltransferase [Candidatus Ancillula sp.]|jgi:predicted GNAT family acetyltransferase|nr:N-acetyltransferase [Candidatus Ancillula sp.]